MASTRTASASRECRTNDFNPPFVLDAALNAGANAAASLQKSLPNLPRPPPSKFRGQVRLPGPPFYREQIPRAATITDPDLRSLRSSSFDLDLQVQPQELRFLNRVCRRQGHASRASAEQSISLYVANPSTWGSQDAKVADCAPR